MQLISCHLFSLVPTIWSASGICALAFRGHGSPYQGHPETLLPRKSYWLWVLNDYRLQILHIKTVSGQLSQTQHLILHGRLTSTVGNRTVSFPTKSWRLAIEPSWEMNVADNSDDLSFMRQGNGQDAI